MIDILRRFAILVVSARSVDPVVGSGKIVESIEPLWGRHGSGLSPLSVASFLLCRGVHQRGFFIPLPSADRPMHESVWRSASSPIMKARLAQVRATRPLRPATWQKPPAQRRRTPMTAVVAVTSRGKCWWMTAPRAGVEGHKTLSKRVIRSGFAVPRWSRPRMKAGAMSLGETA